MSTTKPSSKEQSSSVFDQAFDPEEFWSRTYSKHQRQQSLYELVNSGHDGQWEVSRKQESKNSKHATHHRTAMENFSQQLRNRIPSTSDDAGYDNKSYSAQLRDLQSLAPTLVREMSADPRSPTIALEGGNVDPRVFCGNDVPKSTLCISVTSKDSNLPHRTPLVAASSAVGKTVKVMNNAFFP